MPKYLYRLLCLLLCCGHIAATSPALKKGIEHLPHEELSQGPLKCLCKKKWHCCAACIAGASAAVTLCYYWCYGDRLGRWFRRNLHQSWNGFYSRLPIYGLEENSVSSSTSDTPPHHQQHHTAPQIIHHQDARLLSQEESHTSDTASEVKEDDQEPHTPTAEEDVEEALQNCWNSITRSYETRPDPKHNLKYIFLPSSALKNWIEKKTEAACIARFDRLLTKEGRVVSSLYDLIDPMYRKMPPIQLSMILEGIINTFYKPNAPKDCYKSEKVRAPLTAYLILQRSQLLEDCLKYNKPHLALYLAKKMQPPLPKLENEKAFYDYYTERERCYQLLRLLQGYNVDNVIFSTEEAQKSYLADLANFAAPSLKVIAPLVQKKKEQVNEKETNIIQKKTCGVIVDYELKTTYVIKEEEIMQEEEECKKLQADYRKWEAVAEVYKTLPKLRYQHQDHASSTNSLLVSE